MRAGARRTLFPAPATPKRPYTLLTFAWITLAHPAAHAADPVVSGLPNGLSLVVVPTVSTPDLVAWQLWMDVGSGDEVQAGRTGFAHFFEHLMFHGSQAIPGDAREAELLRLAVEENAWTWLDDTVYHAVLPASSLERYAELEADRFTSLHLTPDGVRREAGAVHGEFRKSQADPEAVLHERMAAAAFRVHPYGHDTIGLEADIARMPDAHADALAFHDLFYRPANATLIVAGDVEPDAVQTLVERTLGRWEVGTKPRPEIPVEPPQQELRRVEVDWPTPTAPLLSMGWKIPARSDVATRAALELGGQLLLHPTGRLKERLVRDEGLALSVRGGPDGTRDPGLFRIELALRDVAHLERAEAIVREELARLAEGVEEAALDPVRAHVVAREVLRSDDPAAVADALGEARVPGGELGPHEAREAWLAALRDVPAAEVAQALRTWLVDAGLTLGTLRPPAEAP